MEVRVLSWAPHTPSRAFVIDQKPAQKAGFLLFEPHQRSQGFIDSRAICGPQCGPWLQAHSARPTMPLTDTAAKNAKAGQTIKKLS
ncbi:MAG: hypothetical protein ACOVLI_00125, partial [Rhabdaerophilum sp.]